MENSNEIYILIAYGLRCSGTPYIHVASSFDVDEADILEYLLSSTQFKKTSNSSAGINKLKPGVIYCIELTFKDSNNVTVETLLSQNLMQAAIDQARYSLRMQLSILNYDEDELDLPC